MLEEILSVPSIISTLTLLIIMLIICLMMYSELLLTLSLIKLGEADDFKKERQFQERQKRELEKELRPKRDMLDVREKILFILWGRFFNIYFKSLYFNILRIFSFFLHVLNRLYIYIFIDVFQSVCNEENKETKNGFCINVMDVFSIFL